MGNSHSVTLQMNVTEMVINGLRLSSSIMGANYQLISTYLRTFLSNKLKVFKVNFLLITVVFHLNVLDTLN